MRRTTFESFLLLTLVLIVGCLHALPVTIIGKTKKQGLPQRCPRPGFPPFRRGKLCEAYMIFLEES